MTEIKLEEPYVTPVFMGYAYYGHCASISFQVHTYKGVIYNQQTSPQSSNLDSLPSPLFWHHNIFYNPLFLGTQEIHGGQG